MKFAIINSDQHFNIAYTNIQVTVGHVILEQSEIWTTRQYYIPTLQQQQDCIEFLEAIMDRSRPKFESLFGFQELYTIRCNTCNHTTVNNAPTSLILHFPQHRSQILQTLFSTNQNVWNTLDDYKYNNCNNIGGSEDKHQIIEENEYIVIQLKLFIPTFVNGQFVPKKITDLKLSGIPTSILEIAGAQYKTQAAILHTYGKKHELWPLYCIPETRNFQLGLC
ncbi:ubiquitin carboxyl-terminal hydrolase 25-like [Aphis craccivora]|uniref:Ubiquitin carboxyl-terminal hydrolase 25-like n=1 Tax=Aphis craccivora TaxID=307492 RepID=A0A6G0W252_APHCR|nr:ubiquitin carboxyl-terminal hydrolase 25-like [Aphis craccivora]